MSRTYKDRIGDRLVNLEYFFNHLEENPTTGCLEWTGVKNNIGYGFIGFRDAITKKRGMMTVHRLALMIKLGREIGPGLNSNHSCHNKLCCSEHHVSEGTQKQKLNDMRKDGYPMCCSTGRKVGSRSDVKQNRNYKYSDQEINEVRNSRIKDIMVKYNLPYRRAATFRASLRSGYKWLPWIKQ